MKPLALIVLVALLAGVAWHGHVRGGWELDRHGAAGGLLLLAFLLVALPGRSRRRRRSPEVARTKFRLEIPPGPVPLGEKVAVKCHVAVPGSFQIVHIDLAVINRRYEKKAPLDRVVSQSIFLFRFPIGQALEKDAERSFDVSFRTLTCRESTRESKYVSITWEILPTLQFSDSGADAAHRYVYEAAAVPIEFTSLQGF